MISKLLISLVFMGLILSAVGFVALAVWDVPVAQKEIEKPVDSSVFLGKK